ncbi:hypothetical protein JCGZ_00171 [Jatropha curcas]|uniref:Uncharacterized protein n=1 Tax=Jatropha curcas TaxID=180498 RepID=A0A067L2L4_JATCU|nr:hypothetical protein JCGZ_00171 [Jatropha curcas]
MSGAILSEGISAQVKATLEFQRENLKQQTDSNKGESDYCHSASQASSRLVVPSTPPPKLIEAERVVDEVKEGQAVLETNNSNLANGFEEHASKDNIVCMREFFSDYIAPGTIKDLAISEVGPIQIVKNVLDPPYSIDVARDLSTSETNNRSVGQGNGPLLTDNGLNNLAVISNSLVVVNGTKNESNTGLFNKGCLSNDLEKEEQYPLVTYKSNYHKTLAMTRAKFYASRTSNLPNRNLLQSINEEAADELEEAKKTGNWGKKLGYSLKVRI